MQGQQRIGSRPDPVTLLSILGACATLSASMLGRLIHSAIIDANCESELSIANALLNMYAKCGDSDDGLCVFNKMPARDVISWTAMISAYAQVGLVEDSIRLFAAMQDSGICPNEITYVNVLSACSHEGKVEEGFHCFVSVFGGRGSMMMMPTSQHYGCLVDLYARAGRLEEAEIILRNSEVRSNAVIWQTLLGACRFHDDVDRGKRAAEHVIMLDPSISASYVALSDFYAHET
jgi:pentatricopeptide repeat protein